MSALDALGRAPPVFSPSSPSPVSSRDDDDDRAPAFRSVLRTAKRSDPPRARDDRESIDSDRGRDAVDNDRGRDDDTQGADNDHDTAQAQTAQQLAMQALTLAGMTPPTQAATAAVPAAQAQVDQISQLGALAGLGGMRQLGALGQLGQLGALKGLGAQLDAKASTATGVAATTTGKATDTTAIDPRLAALLGSLTGAAPAPSTASPLATATAKPTAQLDATPGATQLTAAVNHAASALASVANSADTAPSIADAAIAASKAAAVLVAAGDSTSATALTPLEQAVHDLIAERGERTGARKLKLDDSDPRAADPTADPSAVLGQLAAQPASARAVTGPSRAAELDPTRPATLAQAADAPSNPSHVHLVLDDGPDRVVVTVAVRGSDIHVALRGSDDATTNALARNAASLDHAMRARGLQLSELTTERDPRQPDSQRQDAEPRERQTPNGQRFKLEENL